MSIRDVPPICGRCPFSKTMLFFGDIPIPVCGHKDGFKDGEPLCVVMSDEPPPQCPLVKVKEATKDALWLKRKWAWHQATHEKNAVALP